MSGAELTQKLENLFRETGRAHHKAFAATGGEDPEWPLWYADYLKEKLEKLLGVPFIKSELVYLIMTAEKERAASDPNAAWPACYAKLIAEKYT